MMRFGKITEILADEGKVRVKFTDLDNIVSNPIPVVVPAALEDKFFIPFAINEQVCCMMDENCEYGAVLGAIYSRDTRPPGSANPDTIAISIGANNLQITIDRQSGSLSLEVNGDVSVKCNNARIESNSVIGLKTQALEIDAPNANFTGNVTISGAATAGTVAAGGFAGSNSTPLNATEGILTNADVIAGGKSLKLHIHTVPGSGSTSPPV